MEPYNSRGLILGSAAVVVLTQIACALWIGRQLTDYRPTDNAAEFNDLSEQVTRVESAVSDVQKTADTIQARTGALTDSMGSVARACTLR